MTDTSTVEAEIARAKQSAMDSLSQAAAISPSRTQLPNEIKSESLPVNTNTPRSSVSLEKRSHQMGFKALSSASTGQLASGATGGGGGGGDGIPIEFYCWKDGVVGTIILTASQDFEELPPA